MFVTVSVFTTFGLLNPLLHSCLMKSMVGAFFCSKSNREKYYNFPKNRSKVRATKTNADKMSRRSSHYSKYEKNTDMTNWFDRFSSTSMQHVAQTFSQVCLLEIPVSFEYSRGSTLFCLSSPVLNRRRAWKQAVFDVTLPGTQVLCRGSAVSSVPLCFYCFPPSFFLCLLPVSSCFSPHC